MSRFGIRLGPLQLALIYALVAHIILLGVFVPATHPTQTAEPVGRDIEIALVPSGVSSAPVSAPPAAPTIEPEPVNSPTAQTPAAEAEVDAMPANPSVEPAKPAPGLLSAESLTQQIMDVTAKLSRSQEIERQSQKIVYVKELRAHKPIAAAYEQAWQEKVERIGNLNYPEQARKEKISGSLTLAVAIRPDGSLYSIKVLQSSGQAVLDEAARNIVNLCAPFAPFPEELKKEVGILVITRTWRFLNDYHLETKGD